MPLYALGELVPQTPGPGRFWIAPGAHVIGDVRLGQDVGIWFAAQHRAEPDADIQEHVVIHADPGFPVRIGAGVTVGHRAIVHGCTIGDGTLIGMGATVLNGARIGSNCLIGAGALVTEGKDIPDGALVMGSPAKVVRMLGDEGRAGLRRPAEAYVQNWRRFARELRGID